MSQVAAALNNRGATREENGEVERALTDYTLVIKLSPGLPLETVADALAKRGWLHYQQKNFEQFFEDTQAALRSNDQLDFVAFNYGLALLANGRDGEAMDAYKHAALKFQTGIAEIGLADLAEAQKTWLSEERADPIVHMLRSKLPSEAASRVSA